MLLGLGLTQQQANNTLLSLEELEILYTIQDIWTPLRSFMQAIQSGKLVSSTCFIFDYVFHTFVQNC